MYGVYNGCVLAGPRPGMMPQGMPPQSRPMPPGMVRIHHMVVSWVANFLLLRIFFCFYFGVANVEVMFTNWTILKPLPHSNKNAREAGQGEASVAM